MLVILFIHFWIDISSYRLVFKKAFRFVWLMKKFFPDQLNGLNALDFIN